jgi:hypothetical protein
LLADVKRRTFLPISQITYTDDDILDYADEELQTGIVPLLMSVREDYLIDWEDTPLDASNPVYPIPSRAIAMKLKMVTVVENNSDPNNPIEILIPRIMTDQGPTRLLNNYPGYFIRDDSIVLQNPGAFAGKDLRQYFFLRRNKLIPAANAAQIVAVGPQSAIPVLAANQVLVNRIPANFGSSALINQVVDVVKGAPGFDTTQLSQSVVCDANALTITFSNLTTIPDTIKVGDWVCLEGESCIPQIPVELMPVLAQRVAVKILEGLGDTANLNIAQAKLKEVEKSVLMVLTNRVEGQPKKILNPYSTLRVFPWRRY